MAKNDEMSEFSLGRSATHLLHRAQQMAVNLSSEALGKKGLTIRQFAVLAALYEENGQSQSSLVDMTGIDRSTLADMVARMEKSGLVARTVSEEDARAKAVSLTAAGQKTFKNSVPVVQEADKVLIEDLRKVRRASLIESLAVISGLEVEEEDEENEIKQRKSAMKKKKKKKKKKKAK
ncbi:MAG: MarR family transcriptional regulator [Pseudomonadota bacterium]